MRGEEEGRNEEYAYVSGFSSLWMMVPFIELGIKEEGKNLFHYSVWCRQLSLWKIGKKCPLAAWGNA